MKPKVWAELIRRYLPVVVEAILQWRDHHWKVPAHLVHAEQEDGDDGGPAIPNSCQCQKEAKYVSHPDKKKSTKNRFES
jgi:hypothetical protein